jgi:hemolysin III
MTAGTYTPVCLLVLDGWVAVVMLVSAWSAAAAGALLSMSSGRRSNVLRSSLYLALGWAVVIAAPQLVSNLSTAELTLIAIGGVLFTVGAITLATHWPDPFPRVFGHHEVWHTFVVAAVICHLVAIGSVVSGAGTA